MKKVYIKKTEEEKTKTIIDKMVVRILNADKLRRDHCARIWDNLPSDEEYDKVFDVAAEKGCDIYFKLWSKDEE